MKRFVSPLLISYQLLVAYPLSLVITLMVAVATTILSPLFPNHSVSYFPARWWARAICYLFFVKVKISGLHNINPSHSYIMAANHQSIFDVFIIYGWLPNLFKWIMKAELRRIPFVGRACEAAGHIFINRSNPIATLNSIQKAERQLINGLSVVIFPEGTRTYTGELGSFKKGAFRIAADLQLPIVPVTINGAYFCLPRQSLFVKPATVTVHFHKPIDIKPFLPDAVHQLIEQTRNRIESKL
jgi:1-acyl-sn-glycerol-3-phosphate acyltransferase